jgi:radical SAM superfamily enzyme YgiQ (UPF0313 family)
MKVLLCTQHHGINGLVFPSGIVFPLGLAYVASMLKEHDVRILDTNVVKDPMGELAKLLNDYEPDVVGISLRNIDLLNPPRYDLDYYKHFRSMTKLIKKESPSSKIVVGGTGFSIFSEQIMEENKEIDFGVVSHGETTIADLMRNLGHPEKVRNLLLRDKKGFQFTGRGETSDFDLLPSPSRHLFDLSEYRKTPFSMGVQSKRGCAFRCSYCPDPFLGGYNLQLRSAEKVVDEIDELVNNYGFKSFFFTDPIFNYPLEHAREICKEMRRRKLDVEWNAYFREDFLNLRFAQEVVEAGCRIFQFHSDGACDSTLLLLDKKIKMREIERTMDTVCKIENAKAGYTFFYDLPRGNLRNLLALARLTIKTPSRCRQKLAYLVTVRMRIFPHTELYDVALKEGKIAKDTNLLQPIYYTSSSSKLQEKYTLFLDNVRAKLIWLLGKTG